MLPRAALLLTLIATAALAAEKPVIKYKPTSTDDEERPVATAITIGPQGSDFALKVEFDKVPWGEDCKSRCANLTLFLDTDNNPATGLQLGKDQPETGADLAVIIQGAKDYKEGSAEVLLKVKAIQLSDGAKSTDSGDTIADMDNRHDSERIQTDGKNVYALIDGTNATLPSGKVTRVVYHPPGAKALQGKTKGLMAAGSGKVEIFRKGKPEAGAKKPKPKEEP